MARKRCAATGKDRFPNKLEADLAIADIERSNRHHRHRKFREEPTRAYHCDHCKDWHFTSQTKNENRRTLSH